MENTFSNTMEGNKASLTGQAVYKCGLCSKEYFYYRDLAMHERAHLNQMGLAGSVPGGTLPPYHDSRGAAYNSATLPPPPPPTKLDSFEKLAQPFHGEAQLRSNSEPRSISQSSPAPHPTLEQDKVPMTYRSEAENRTILDTRSPDNRSVAMETRPLPVDSRPMSFGPRNIQSPDVRSIPHSEAHSLSYSSSQYMGNTVHPMYSDLNNKHAPVSSLGSYSATQVSHSGDYFTADVRNQFLPKLGPQIYGKSESFYPTDKTHYSYIPEKPHDVYASSQYGVSKLLAQTHQDPYYGTTSHPPPAALSKFDVDKMSGLPVSSYYTHSQQPHSTDALLKHDIRSVGQKSNLYYGSPHETTSMATPTSNMPYHMAPPKVHETSNTYVRDPVNKLPERPIANRPFPTGHVSPHLPYTDLYKGGHYQPQVFPSMPSQISTSHVDYNSYKPAVEPVPSVNLHAEGNHHTVRQFPLEYTCHVCHLPCTNSHELSEHMKIHAMAQSVPIPHYVPQSSSASNSFTVPTLSMKHQTTPDRNVAMSTSGLEEHKKSHINSDEYKYHCKTCDMFFSDSAKFVRHEQKHKRSGGILYCEFCMETFTLKGNYLHHMTQKHGPPRSNTSIVDAAGKRVNEPSNPASRLILDLVNITDCQICDLEVYREQLVEHLSTHPLFMCRICDWKFVQNTELVEHLMKQHSKELEGSANNSNRTKSNTAPSNQVGKPLAIQRAKLEEEDSGLEEDKDDEGRLGPFNRNREPETGHKQVDVKGKAQTVSKYASPTSSGKTVLEGKTVIGQQKHPLENSNRKSFDKDKAEKKLKKAEMKNLKENIQKKGEIGKAVTGDKQQVKTSVSSMSDTSTLDNSDSLELEIVHKKMKFSCSKCDKSFAKHGDLVQHVEIHNKDPSRIYCEVCDLSYHIKEKGYYMYHMKFHKDLDLVNSQHPDMLTCVVCNKEFKKQVLISHIHQHTHFSCDICQWSYSSESSLITHMKRIHGKKFLKGMMKKVVEQKPSPVVYRKLKDIQAEGHGDDNSKYGSEQDGQTTKGRLFRCEICRKTLTSKVFFEKHMLKHSLTVEEQQISCDVCKQPFSSKGSYLFHLLKDHTKSTILESQGQSDKHIKLDEKEESGSTPSDVNQDENVVTDKKQTVKQVLTTVLNPVTGDFEEVLVDEAEGEGSVSDNCLDKVSDSDKQSEGTDLKGKLNIKDVIYCKLCNKSLNKEDLLNHMNTHTFFHCDTCKFTYTKKKPFLHHVKLMHIERLIKEEEEKVTPVTTVGKGASETVDVNSTPVAAAKEKRRRSETTKLISCPLCSGEFKQHLYVQHIKTHLQQSWKCQFCSREFSKQPYLAIHEKSHERICHSSSLPYPLYCPACNTNLKSRNDYVEHMCVHLRRSPFKCKSCSETFLYDKAGEVHMRVQHDVNGRIVWKLDGEGVKFDVKTGRITDVISDYIVEIREINDLLKQYGKPEIWISHPASARKKEKESLRSRSLSEDEDSKDDKQDVSDDEYIPNSKKTFRKRQSQKHDSDSEGDVKGKRTMRKPQPQKDDSDSEEEGKGKRTLRKRKPQKDESESEDEGKGKRTLRKRQPQKDESESDEDDDEDDDEEVDTSTRSRPKRRRTTSSIAESNSDDDKDTPRGTKSRDKTRGKSLDAKKTPTRKPAFIARRSSPRSAKLDTKCKQSIDKGKSEQRKSVDNVRSPRVLRGNIAKSSTSGSDDQRNTKTPNTPTTPTLRKRLKNHKQQKDKLKGSINRTPASGRLKTRTRNLRSDLDEPCSSSTPIRQARAVVKISPLQMDVGETMTVKSESKPSPNRKLKCHICKKLLYNNKWNFLQHVKRCEKELQDAKRDIKKNLKQKEQGPNMVLDENKPFSCKVCSESFKKKRDLYIHAKIHITEVIDEGAGLNSSVESVDTSSIVEDSTASSLSSTLNSDTSTVATSQGDSQLETRSDINTAAELSNTDLQNGYSNSKNTSKVDDVKEVSEQIVDISKGGDQVVNNEQPQSNNSLSVSDKVVNVTKNVDDTSKPVNEQIDEVNKNDSKSETIHHHEVNSLNNNSNVNNKEENDSEERSKAPRNVPAVNKMSSEAALSKWKSKVAATLSSQLELNATKAQLELDNPEAAKVKEFLSKSGKPDRKNYECRICGDMFDAEVKFREHMDVHLNQSPPYCSLCNMYFMAIYPIRRLLEHNRKKHPELVAKAVPTSKPN